MKKISVRHIALPFSVMLSGAVLFGADEESADTGQRDSIVDLDPVRVVGSDEGIGLLPGSADFIEQEEILRQNYDDIHKVLRKTPGVYVREEDGYGIFANISLRGANSNRSQKVTLMEDGVLTAPAPYAAPAAYYTPTVGRMSGVELLKGSSQIKYGPETTGGVINYLSTSIPQAQSGFLRAQYGTDNDIRLHGTYGETVETGFGTFSFLFENYHRRTDGFKTIDERPGFEAGDDTGFTKNEPMVKFAFEPNTQNNQRIEFKAGYTDLDFNETYLGLTEEDFSRDPYRRYAASRFDNMDADQFRTYLRHVVEPTPDSRLTTTAYYNEFNRNWFKLGSVSADPDGNGGFETPAQVLAGGFQDELDVLKGNGEGSFRNRNNNRAYASYGLQSNLQLEFETDTLDHLVDVGVRVHEDYEDRFQNEVVYRQNDDGAIVGRTEEAPGSQADKRSEARAIAVHLQDRIDFGKWAVTPGIRYEHIRYTIKDRQPSPNTRESADLDVFAPGVGVNYDYTDDLSFFGGAYRGISMPGPSARVNDNLDEETTNSFEVGSRYNNHQGFRSEAVFFYSDFNDLIVPESIGSGQPETENAGDATVYGVELLVGYDPGVANDWSFRMPNTLSVTWTEAELDNDTSSQDAESIFSGGRKGNRLPYIPEYSIAAGTGIEVGSWGFYVDASYLPSTYASANNSSEQINPETGDPDSRFGEIDSRFLVDLSSSYQLTESARVFGMVHNVFDKEYMVSRLPHGPRPGQPLTASIGMEVTF